VLRGSTTVKITDLRKALEASQTKNKDTAIKLEEAATKINR
jgi:hypothetical protein